MRKCKQVKRKEVIFSMDEWKVVEDKTSSVMMKTREFNKSKAKRMIVGYNEWQSEQRGTSWKQKIRLEIDGLILKVKNVDELLAELEMLGYTVQRGKYSSVKAPDQQRAVRLKTFGEELHSRTACFENFVERRRSRIK